jgi:eukaryotic-like serine/threonine-protein kinase
MSDSDDSDKTAPVVDASQRFDVSRFRVLKQLGVGGVGVVYVVRDLQQGRDVALKSWVGIQAASLDYLKLDFPALADLHHLNLVSLYELFVEGDRAYFTMEYVRGQTFLQYVRPSAGINQQRLSNGLSQLATGLTVLHKAGKVHGAIKPSNVLVTPEERVVLLDFGLATETETSETGTSIDVDEKTSGYLSPEQALGMPSTAASDWYSVGVMLYQALTGRLPFRGSRTELIAERQHEGPTPVDVDASVPADLSKLCMSLLAHDPNRRAGAREVFTVVGQAAPKSQASLKPTSILFGRQAELEQLEGALGRVREGEGVTVLVEGTSGVGKTSLVEHFVTWAERPDAVVVLRGRCYEREQVPYQGIDSLMGDVCRLLRGLDPGTAQNVLPRHVAALVRLFPALEEVPAVAERTGRARFVSADERETRRQAFGALRELLALIGDRRTLIVHIDDLQWGDVDTAELLRDVLRPPDAPIMLLILAYRSEDQEGSPCFKVLTEEPIGTETHVHLGPLSTAAAEALMRELLQSKQSKLDVPLLVSEAGGNPFLLHEVAHFAVLQEAGGLSPALDIHAALRARIDRLPSAARELLQTVAVAGHPITEEVAWRATAPAGSATEAWRLLIAEHLVRFSGPPDEWLVETFHDRLRETVLACMTPQRARACRRSLATALEQAGGADPEVLAQLHESSGNPERALEFTRVAAAQATQVLAFDRAARLLQHAVDFAGRDHAPPVDLLKSLAEALGNAGRCLDSARVYLEAANGAEAEARISLRRRAADQLLFAGQIDEGRELIHDDLQAQGFPVPKSRWRTRVSLLWRRALIRLKGFRFSPCDSADIPADTLAFLDHLRSVATVMSFVGLPWDGAEIGTRFLLRALDLGERRLVALGISLIAAHAGAREPFSHRTERLFEVMTRQGRGLHDPAVDGTLSGIRGLRAYFGGEWRDAVRHLDSAEEVLRDCQGRLWELLTARHVGIWSRFFLGEWGDLSQRVFLGWEDARDRGNAYGMAGICSPFGVVAWLSRDEPDEARRILSEVRTLSLKGFPIQRYWFLMAETLIQLYVGDGRGAWEQICLRWRSASIPGLNVQLLHLRGCCALAAAEQSRHSTQKRLLKEAAAAARRLQRAARRPNRAAIQYAAPLAKLLWSGVAAQRGHAEAASKSLEAAIISLHQRDMPVYAAAAQRRLARLRGESPGDFLLGQGIVNPDAITQMLVPGFSAARA